MKVKSIKFNAIMNIILTMSSFIFPLITFPYTSRILMPDGMGRVSFATSIVYYFSIIAQLGIPTYGICECAKVREDVEKLSKTVHEILIINVITTVISYICFVISLFCIPRLAEEKTLFLILSVSIFFNTLGVEWLYKALEKYQYITSRSIAFKVLSLLLLFTFVHKKDDYLIYAAITIFASVGSNILNFIHLSKHVQFKWFGNYNLKRHLKPVLLLFSMSVASVIYTNLDTVMLGFLTSEEEVGYYTAAVKIKTIMVTVVTSLSTVLLPRVTYYWENGLRDEFYRVCEKTFKFLVLLASPIVIFFIIFAKEGIVFLSGAKYIPAVLSMQIIMPTVIFIGLSNLTGIQMMIPMGKTKFVLYSEILGAILDLGINFALIPIMGSAGAALGTVVAEFGVMLYQFLIIKDFVIHAIKKIGFVKWILAVIVSTVIGVITLSLNLVPFFQLLVSGILFIGSYLLVLLVSKDELVCSIIYEMFNKCTRMIKRRNNDV